ncbi:MAG: ABC transporter ATP-binding protein [Clostridiales bacterium]|nr:ABC transporter ATP-binding protein [Clostridiales bacterium]
MLKVKNLESGYDGLRVLKGISMHIFSGEIIAIIGANGAGKTTLLNTLSGLIRPMSGSVTFQDADIAGKRPEDIMSQGCVLVPEGRKLFSNMTIRENLNLGAYSLHKKGRRELVKESYEQVYSLFPRLFERRDQLAGTMSGGEQQMLAIGRALMSQPKLVMLDEPSMGLAPLVIKDIFNSIIQLRKEGKTILVVEQNAKAILKIADRGYVIETGSLIMEGTGRDLLNNKDVQRAYIGKEYKSIDESL